MSKRRNIQHDEVRNSELNHVNQRPDSLFQDTGSISLEDNRCRAGRSILARCAASCLDGLLILDSSSALANQIPVVLFSRAAQELKGHGEEDDADA